MGDLADIDHTDGRECETNVLAITVTIRPRLASDLMIVAGKTSGRGFVVDAAAVTERLTWDGCAINAAMQRV